MENIWDLGAEIYANLTPKISFYQKTAEKVFDFFDNSKVTNICDLGCGSSGLIIEKIFENCQRIESIYCIDSSVKMIEILSRDIKSNKIKIFNADAEYFAHLINVKIDVFIINSAFWLFNLDKTFEQISNCINTSGKVIFNIAEWDYIFLKNNPHPKYTAIDDELRKNGYKIKKSRGSRKKLSEKIIINYINKKGFVIKQKEIIEIEATRDDWLNFYSIPSIVKRSLPELPLETGTRILKNAISKMSINEFTNVKWIFFVVEKIETITMEDK